MEAKLNAEGGCSEVLAGNLQGGETVVMLRGSTPHTVTDCKMFIQVLKILENNPQSMQIFPLNLLT